MPSKQRFKSTRKPKASDELPDSRKYDVERATPQQTELAEPVRSDAREHEVEHAAPQRGRELHPEDVER